MHLAIQLYTFYGIVNAQIIMFYKCVSLCFVCLVRLARLVNKTVVICCKKMLDVRFEIEPN